MCRFLCERRFLCLWYKYPRVQWCVIRWLKVYWFYKKLSNCFPEWIYHVTFPPALYEWQKHSFGLSKIFIFSLVYVLYLYWNLYFCFYNSLNKKVVFFKKSFLLFFLTLCPMIPYLILWLVLSFNNFWLLGVIFL